MMWFVNLNLTNSELILHIVVVGCGVWCVVEFVNIFF